MEEYNVKIILLFVWKNIIYKNEASISKEKPKQGQKMLLYCFPTTYPMLSEVKRLRGKTQLQYDPDQNKDNDQRKGYVKFRN